MNDGLILDFIETDEDFPIYHFCFRVAEKDFDALLKRIHQREMLTVSYARPA